MKLTHIVACAKNGTIGRDGRLPWHLPEDLKFFKKVTSGHIVIMGRKTYESIGKPLPNRLNVVVTRQEGYQAEGVTVVSSLTNAFGLCEELKEKWGEEVFIIGGGEIYRQSFDLVSRVYMTQIHKAVEGDVSYPLDQLAGFEVVSEESHSEPEPFSFVTWRRIGD